MSGRHLMVKVAGPHGGESIPENLQRLADDLEPWLSYFEDEIRHLEANVPHEHRWLLSLMRVNVERLRDVADSATRAHVRALLPEEARNA